MSLASPTPPFSLVGVRPPGRADGALGCLTISIHFLWVALVAGLGLVELEQMNDDLRRSAQRAGVFDRLDRGPEIVPAANLALSI